MNSAVFLDRDGVIIQNRNNYIQSWEDVEFFPQSIEALKKLSQSSHKIIITTNQSAIGRGIITMEDAKAINTRIIETIIRGGGRIDGSFLCPHAPDDYCDCRKPLPGLIIQAADALSIDLPLSVMVGDALSDIQAGAAAGINKLIMVKTGRGLEQIRLARKSTSPEFLIADNLLSAISTILSP